MRNTIAFSTASVLLLILLSNSVKEIHAIVCTYMNEQHNDGDRWVVRSKFIAECRIFSNGSWKVSVVACQTPKGIITQDGDQKVEDYVKYQCKKLPSGEYQIQKHYFNRNIGCEGHNIDTGIPIKLSTSVTLNGTRYNCTVHKNGTVTLTRDFPRNSRIILKGQNYYTVNGIQKKIGEIWIEDTNFIKKCTGQAAVIVEACFADGFTINLNSKLTRNDKIYTCTGNNNGNVLFRIVPNDHFGNSTIT